MKINPRDLERAMKRMGMQTEAIEAEEVVIRTAGKDIVIANPQVTRIVAMGQTSFQIAGEETERERERFSEADVKLVMEKTGADAAGAKKALAEEGDIAAAILKLRK